MPLAYGDPPTAKRVRPVLERDQVAPLGDQRVGTSLELETHYHIVCCMQRICCLLQHCLCFTKTFTIVSSVTTQFYPQVLNVPETTA